MTLEHSTSAAVVSAFAKLAVQPHPDKPLSPVQRHYNLWLARIEMLSGQIERLQAWSDRHRHGHIQALHEGAQQVRDLRKNLLLLLHERLQGDDLTAQHQRMARSLVRHWIGQLDAAADPQVQALAALYRLDEDEQELAEEQALQVQRLREEIESALGQPIHNPSQYQTPEDMLAAGMRQWRRQQQADQERKAAKRAARMARKKPEAQQKAGILQADAQGAIRTIFRQLASALHPDREPDAKARERKTALMSEVNAAYEKGDLSTLLRLQMQAALVGSADASRLADDKLAAMALLLKDQAKALEADLACMEQRLSQELRVPVRADGDEDRMTQSLQRLQADQCQLVQNLESDLQCIGNAAEFKRWLKVRAQLLKDEARGFD